MREDRWSNLEIVLDQFGLQNMVIRIEDLGKVRQFDPALAHLGYLCCSGHTGMDRSPDAE